MANAVTAYAAPGPTETLRALPTIRSGQPVSVLRRCWFATVETDRQQRATLLESSVRVGGEWIRLVDLSIVQIEGALGALTPRHFVRFYDPKKSGTQVATFVVEADALAFAADKKLYSRPAQVRSL